MLNFVVSGPGSPLVSRSRPRTCAVGAEASKEPALSLIKVCGIASAHDAEMVVSEASEVLPESTQLLLGMIIWPGSKRAVSAETARDISRVASEGGAQSVGVFVDETSAEMLSAKSKSGLDYVQLHGPKCRQFYRDLGKDIPVIYVVDVSADGTYDLVDGIAEKDLILFDSKGGGTGRSFDWGNFSPPESRPWLLAGGLSEDNVASAVISLRPSGVDVASGVADSSGVKKDRERVRKFLRRASFPHRTD